MKTWQDYVVLSTATVLIVAAILTSYYSYHTYHFIASGEIVVAGFRQLQAKATEEAEEARKKWQAERAQRQAEAEAAAEKRKVEREQRLREWNDRRERRNNP